MASLKHAALGLAVTALLLLFATRATLGQDEMPPVPEEEQEQEEEAPAPETPEIARPEAEEPAPKEHRRDGVVIGINLGGGAAEPEVTLSGGRRVSGDTQMGVAANARLGYALVNSFVVGVEGLGWFKSYTIFESETGEKFDADVSYSVAGVFAHWFPTGGGFYARGVAGWGWAAINPRTLDSVSDQGFGWTVGLGYQLRATKTIALGPLLEYGSIGVDPQRTLDALGEPIEGDFSAAFLNISLGITWYL